jgi:hypothetical protein
MSKYKSKITQRDPTLRSQFQGFRSGKTHHHTSIGHGFKEDTRERGTGARQRCTCIKMLLIQEPTSAYGREYFEDESAIRLFSRRTGYHGYDCHSLADLYHSQLAGIQGKGVKYKIPCKEYWASLE